MQQRLEKRSLTNKDKNKGFCLCQMEKKWKQESNTLFKVLLYKVCKFLVMKTLCWVSVARFWKWRGCRGGFCERWNEGIMRSVEEKVLQDWAGTSPEGPWPMEDPCWSTGEEREGRSSWGKSLRTDPNPLHRLFPRWRDWVWPAVAPRGRRGAWSDVQPGKVGVKVF